MRVNAPQLVQSYFDNEVFNVDICVADCFVSRGGTHIHQSAFSGQMLKQLLKDWRANRFPDDVYAILCV